MALRAIRNAERGFAQGLVSYLTRTHLACNGSSFLGNPESFINAVPEPTIEWSLVDGHLNAPGRAGSPSTSSSPARVC